ncbi:hypothetical protein A2999_00020 [Candidatus Wolfebacteria bacterium RIFCSPLOWO2_01_FULL_38_11]|uniref:Nmd3 N-terminal domain-containing protein n=2 Tax=Candidatus Wolfeibacteriota TaxID=1752735 RepID=A0A0G0FWL0_9BACT|nr:MAG: hypothetical protein US36_C0001G0002 [Candidatus Wolfebacteria bacterium GW2011_GWC1_37_10]OGM90341.1 MAG: hypothetical protein A2999_00020 [Candidatus Wolfebacteria bacterium RIFCSPLOWO2_01_FULL_38_11]
MEKRKQYDDKIILARREKHEIPKGFKGLVLCPICGASFYKKAWHHNLRNYKNLKENLEVKFLICPACRMIKNKQFEGEVKILNIPQNNLDNLIHLIEAFGHRAYLIDSQHRLINIKKVKDGLIVTTTENQLAVKIAKKIKEVFKKIDIKTSYSPSPSDVVYIKLEFRI